MVDKDKNLENYVSPGHGMVGKVRNWNSLTDDEKARAYLRAIDNIKKNGMKSAESLRSEQERNEYEKRILSTISKRKRVNHYPVKVSKPDSNFAWKSQEYMPSSEVDNFYETKDRKKLELMDLFVERIFGIELGDKINQFDEIENNDNPMFWNIYSKPTVKGKGKVGEGIRSTNLEEVVSRESVNVEPESNQNESYVQSNEKSKKVVPASGKIYTPLIVTGKKSNTVDKKVESDVVSENNENVFAYNKNLYENFSLNTPSFDCKKLEEMPEVNMKAYLKVLWNADKIYQSQRRASKLEDKFSSEQRKELSKITSENLNKLEEFSKIYSNLFKAYSKIYSDAEREKHAEKEEAEGVVFLKNEKVKDLKEDYSEVLSSRPSYFNRNFGKVTEDKAKRNIAYHDARTQIRMAKNELKAYNSNFNSELKTYNNLVSKRFGADREVERMRVLGEKVKFTRGLLDKFAA